MHLPKEDPYRATRVRGSGRLMVPSELGHTPYVAPESEVKPSLKQPLGTLQEWQQRQPGYGRATTPRPKEEEWTTAAPGEGKTLAEQWKAYQSNFEESDSPDEFVGLDAEGKPVIRRRPTGGDVLPPTGIPPSGDGAVDTAMDTYRRAANYPRDKPINAQQGFAVAASTQDYNRQGYSTEAPVSAQIVEYDGREGEVRGYDDGSRFFVSFDDDVILRMKDKKRGLSKR
jgi:hypothetical protein